MRYLQLTLICAAILTACSSPLSGPKPTPVTNDETRAVQAAKKLYEERKTKGDEFKSQCLSEDIIPGWVADIAHQPRTPEDEDPANQCAAFRDGRAKHFVELDPDGNFLRAY